MEESGHKQSKGFGKRAAHPHPIFSETIPPGAVTFWELNHRARGEVAD